MKRFFVTKQFCTSYTNIPWKEILLSFLDAGCSPFLLSFISPFFLDLTQIGIDNCILSNHYYSLHRQTRCTYRRTSRKLTQCHAAPLPTELLRHISGAESTRSIIRVKWSTFESLAFTRSFRRYHDVFSSFLIKM